jgi:hypothetical protein
MPGLYVQINDKGGKHFRKYTEDSLQMLFDAAPTAAVFELTVLIEGLTFMALRIHFINIGEKEGYEKFIKHNDSLECAVNKLALEKIINEELKKELTDFRKMRNDLTHNLFRMKTLDSEIFPELKDYSYSEALSTLFKKGIEIFKAFSQHPWFQSKNSS